jgi:hypothetical protein
VTTYFRNTFNVADPSQFESLQVRLQRDDGAVVYLNGQEVVRSNMPGGTIRSDTFASGTVGGGDETTFFEFEIDLGRLQNGSNTIAVEIHQGNGSSSDISFDLELRGGTFNPTGGAIYYTLDGSDPLLPNEQVNPQATLYNGTPFTLDRTVTMKSRLLDNNQWSPLASANFLLDKPAAVGDLVVTEINYNPHRPMASLGELDVDKDNFEFIELLNISSQRIDLTEVRFATVVETDGSSQGIDFVFDTQTLEPGTRIVVAKDRSAFASRYGDQVRLADGSGDAADDGVYGGNLRNSGELLTLLAADGSTIQQFAFDDSGGWPGRADGGASTLEVINPLGDFLSPQNWRSSNEFGGTPGALGTGPIRNVVINEVLTHTDLPQIDAVELLNTTGSPIAIGGWYISDGNDDYFRYPISIIQPALGAGEYLVINETQLGFGFRGQESDDVWLVEAALTGEPIRFADHVEFDAAVNGVSLGRWPNGQGNLFPMTANTFGASNSGPAISPVVIGEVHYNPPGTANLTSQQLEFVEIWNHSNSAVDIGNWRLDKGVDFNFAAGTVLAAGQRIVVASFDPVANANIAGLFRNAYGLNAATTIVGPYRGILDNGGEKVELQKPEDVAQLGLGYVLTDRVDFDDDLPWPASADGGGVSLNRTTGSSYGDSVSSWVAVAPTPGTAPNVDNLPGDFNGDRLVNNHDIDLLCQRIRNGGAVGNFDLTSDGAVNADDVDRLVEQILGTTAGDANLDGLFNSGDLVQIFQRGQYEDGIAGNSGWAEGDWDCSGDFDTGDLVTAFQAGSYTAASVAAPRTNVAGAILNSAQSASFASNETGSRPAPIARPSSRNKTELELRTVEHIFSEPEVSTKVPRSSVEDIELDRLAEHGEIYDSKR